VPNLELCTKGTAEPLETQQVALAALEPGGVPVVWKLDRLGRLMLDTVKIVLDLNRRGIGFRSLTERPAHEKVPSASDTVESRYPESNGRPSA
jgi:hypothetical protein